MAMPRTNSITQPWEAPFRFSGEEYHVSHQVPTQVAAVTEAIRDAYHRRSRSTIVAPALGGVGTALVVRNLIYALRRDRGDLVITGVPRHFIEAYKELEDPHQGSFADRCPLVMRGLSDSEIQLAGPRKSKRGAPVWKVRWAASPSDVRYWIDRLELPRLLVIDRPAALFLQSTPCPTVSLSMHLLGSDGREGSGEGPVRLILPSDDAQGFGSENELLAQAHYRWRNSVAPVIKVRILRVPGSPSSELPSSLPSGGDRDLAELEREIGPLLHEGTLPLVRP